MKSMHELGIPVPVNKSLVTRTLKNITLEQRARALKATEYNVFSFPADMLVVDFLSDSGTTTMTDYQWASLFHGDESYGRNKGYYVLLDAIRDTFERGENKKKVINYILTGEDDIEILLNKIYLKSYEGGFVNGGIHQLARPNAFITPQGRCAEFLLFSTLADVLFKNNPKIQYYIPNNGHFDTTEANIRANNLHPVNLFSEDLFSEFPYEDMATKNPFKGNMNLPNLVKLIEDKTPEKIPIIYLTITNNTAGGQPVSLANIKEVQAIAVKYNIPLFFDACRFAENAYFIQQFEPSYKNKSIPCIIEECFSYVDGFTISFKKDGLANMGGGLFFRDKGVFHTRFSIDGDIGVLLKEKQILVFGNDSYGGLSGRDIMALTTGLYEVIKESYLKGRITQIRKFALELAKRNIPILLPAGGHAVYLDMNEFFKDTSKKLDDFGGVGLTLELIKNYGIRACELGPFAFEWDKKTSEERKGVLNLVRFAVPRNAYNDTHIDYTVRALEELHKNREKIPNIKISRGAELKLRHFQTGLEPIYNE
jgi:tryptophanase